MTGATNSAYGLEWVLSPHRTTGTCRWGLDEREKTLGDLLRQEGYATAALGKWHVGDREPFFPTNRGFDYFYGYLQAGHFYLNPNPDERDTRSTPGFAGRWPTAASMGSAISSTTTTPRCIATTKWPAFRAI